MEENKMWEPARQPEDLARYFVERAKVGDAEGLVALYEPEAVLVGPEGQLLKGHEAIRAFYRSLLAEHLDFQPGAQRPAVRNGGLALTSSRLVSGRVTAEVARLQPDGSWRWVIDQPAVARETVQPM